MSDLLNSKVSKQVLDGARQLADQFANASPFKHVSIDGFFTEDTVQALVEHFPGFDEKLAINENGEVGAKAVHEKVRNLGNPYQELDDLVKTEEFRELISTITGIPDLRYDPHYFGGGTHENLHGQSLDAHVDFNFHPITRQHRRLNMIFYLSDEWKDEWGGSIQLHRDPYLPPSQDEIVVVTPLFNRCVIFETNEYSWHGFPRINLPEEKRHLSRKSFALYYYTDTRPSEELGPEHSTIYVEQHLPEDWAGDISLTAEQMQHIRNLIGSRDQHLRRLYGNVKQLYTELNHLKEAHGHQAPPGIAPEPPEPVAPLAEPEQVESSDASEGSDEVIASEVSSEVTVTDTADSEAESQGENALAVDSSLEGQLADKEEALKKLAETAAKEQEALKSEHKKHLKSASEELEYLQAKLLREQAAIARREAELERYKRRVEELEQSTSWRITAPVRSVKRMFKSG